jgi:hypothetical protein
MDQPKGHHNSLNYPSKYKPFGISEIGIGDLNLIGFELAIEKIHKKNS